MDNEIIEQKIDAILVKARKILNKKIWEVAPLIADIEELKGHIISKDIVRLSEQIKWIEKKKK